MIGLTSRTWELSIPEVAIQTSMVKHTLSFKRWNSNHIPLSYLLLLVISFYILHKTSTLYLVAFTDSFITFAVHYFFLHYIHCCVCPSTLCPWGTLCPCWGAFRTLSHRALPDSGPYIYTMHNHLSHKAKSFYGPALMWYIGTLRVLPPDI